MAARALLDAAYHIVSNRTPEWLIMAVRVSSFPSDEVIYLSEKLGMQDAVRRICSIASLLPDKETSAKSWLRELQEYTYGLEDEYIWLDAEIPKNHIHWKDEKFGVLWNISPEDVRDYCYVA